MSDVSGGRELLYPLSLFRRDGGAPLPGFTVVEGGAMPEPFHSLLVHHGDMTSRLEAHFGAPITLRVLHCEQRPGQYLREVVLCAGSVKMPVEYGAIEIDLDAFSPEVRALIVEGREPRGGLLNRFAIEYRSEPRAFITLGPDPGMRGHLGAPAASVFHGRCNVLLGAGGRVLAHIVEILKP
jgi:hypothetical protein